MVNPKADISRVINSVVQKKLDNKILELIDLAAKNQYDENLEKYIKTAKENNFKTELDMLYEIGCDLALEFLKTSKEKKTVEQIREQKERNLEDYLINPVNLEKIEKGLVFEEKQAELNSGRIDIRAKDQNNKNVFIELKTGYDSPKDLFLQIGKYLGAAKKEDRLFFVTPEIKAEVYYGLKQIDKDKQLSIFLVDENKKDYEFKKVNDEYFANQPKKNIPWDKVAKVRKAKIEEEEKSTIVKIKSNKNYLNNIMNMNKKGNNKDSKHLPKEERQNLPDWFNRFTDKYLIKLERGDFEVKQTEVSGTVKKSLEKLVFPRKLKLALREHESHHDWFKTNEELSDMIINYNTLNTIDNNKETYETINMFLFYTTEQELAKYRSRFVDIMRDFSSVIMNHENKYKGDVEEIITELEKPYKKQEKIFQEIRNDKLLLKTLHALKTYNNSGSDLEKHLIKAYTYNLSFIDAKITHEFMKIKIARTKELAKISNELALTYLFWDPLKDALDSVGEGLNYQEGLVKVTQNSFHNMIVIDSHHYASLLNFLKSDNDVIGEEILEKFDLKVLIPNDSNFLELKGYQKNTMYSKTKEFEEENNEFEQNNVETINVKSTINSREKKYLEIIDAIYHTGNGIRNGLYLTEDMKKRIEYFAEDITDSNISDDKINLLTNSLKSFKLTKKFRHKEDCCSKNELSFRNFFDDMMLNYVWNDKIPQVDDLEKIHHNNFENYK